MIEVSHVSRTFGTFRAVNDVSFSIPTGQIVGLLGPNGAGKTTTMRMITGFLKPTDGSTANSRRTSSTPFGNLNDQCCSYRSHVSSAYIEKRVGKPMKRYCRQTH